MVEEVNKDSVKDNANYLVDVLGTPLEKCLKIAQKYPFMTKEELLNFCINTPEFFN